MTEDVKRLQEERTQIYHDVYDNKIPKRVPINVNLSLNVIAEYAGIPGAEALWHPEKLLDAADELARIIPTDINIVGMQILTPSKYQSLGATSMKMSASGFMQHPNHVGMFPEDYDAFIENPYDCIIERVLPRNYQELATPGRQMFAISQAMKLHGATAAENLKLMRELSDRYGYYSAPPGTGAGVYAPVDIITDTLRSLSGMSVDIRRMPDKVMKAVEAVYPLNYKCGLPGRISNYGQCFFPLHLATFIKEKDFIPLFWKPWVRQVTDYASMGYHSQGFFEHNWMRYLDHLTDLPVDTRIQFEQGDPKIIKEKLGRRYILTGLFPLAHLRNCTKQECIDKTKEYLDIMMPNGKFIFSFDKSALTLGDVNIENLAAICETVLTYGVYDNPGEKAGEEFHKEDYVHSEVPPFQSKYYKTWEQYLEENPYTPESAKPAIMAAEDEIVKFVYGLCQ